MYANMKVNVNANVNVNFKFNVNVNVKLDIWTRKSRKTLKLGHVVILPLPILERKRNSWTNISEKHTGKHLGSC